jgi:type VI protein secretion system component Hcp
MKLLLAVVALVCLARPAVAQSGDLVVNTGGSVNCVNVKGESGFDALSYSLGGENTSTVVGGTGQQLKKPSLSDLNIQRTFDPCSEALIQSFLSGKVMPTVTLIQYAKVTSNATPYAALTITLSNALINSYQISGSASLRPTESVAFTYSKVCVASVAQRPDGSLAQPVRVCYDLSKNLVSS